MTRIIIVAALAAAIGGGCKKKPPTAPDSSPPPGSPSNSTSTPAPGPSGSASSPLTVGSGGGGGGVMSVRKAARRTQSLNELNNLATIIEGLKDPFGKMPTRDQVMNDLKKSAPNIYKAIDEGSYILTGTADPSGLWAYEADGDKQDGVAILGGRAQRVTADEVRSHLGTKQ